MQPKDSLELHNLPLLITVKCKKRDDTGDVVNEIRGYAKKEAADGVAAAGDDEHSALGAPMIELELPFPPSVNHYYRRVGPRTLISREGRRFRERVCAHPRGLGIGAMAGPLHVEIEVYPPDRRRRDIDNVQKALLDALQHGGLYADDSQIRELNIEMRGCVPGGRTLVRSGGVAECLSSGPISRRRSPRSTATCANATTTRAW